MLELKDRKDLLEKKEEELNLIITDIFDSIYIGDSINCTKPIEDFYNSGFINITAPQEKPPILHMLTMDLLSNYKKGKSFKPGNIKLNFRKLIDSLPEIIIDTVSVFYDIPIVKVYAALSVWKLLRNIMTIEITKAQAIVIYSLWKNCSETQKITLEDGFKNVNNLIRNIDEIEMVWDEYVEIVEELSKLDCLVIDDTGIWLRECISNQYR